MSAGLVVGYLFVLIFLYVLGNSYWRPLLFLYRFFLKSAVGALLVYLFNSGTAQWNLEIPLNPFNALIVGFLGFPGMFLLILAKYVVGV
jgi:inhibitor of the pro-sigma K processing machinery